jgi:hypothetical protein
MMIPTHNAMKCGMPAICGNSIIIAVAKRRMPIDFLLKEKTARPVKT